MKVQTIAAAVLALISVTGCSSTPKDIGQPYVQDKSKSFALNVGAYAGFPHVLKDNNYSHGLDTLVVSSSNAMLLADDLGSSMGALSAGALGAGLGFMNGFLAEFPLDAAKVFTARLNAGENYKDANTVLRVINDNYEKRPEKVNESKGLKGFFDKKDLSAFVCTPSSSSRWDFSCYDPAFENYNVYVKATRPANGQEFKGVMNLPVDNYGVYVIRNDRGSVLVPKKNAPDKYFYLEQGAYVLSDSKTVLPRVAPREDGKRLVIIDGKATLI